MLHAHFTLRDEPAATRLYAFLKANWRAMASEDRPLHVVVSEKKPKRTDEQNRLYWARMGEIASQAWVDGRQYSKDVWHEYFKGLYGPKVEGPHGKLVCLSTTDLPVDEFTAYMNEIEADAAGNLGVRFSE